MENLGFLSEFLIVFKPLLSAILGEILDFSDRVQRKVVFTRSGQPIQHLTHGANKRTEVAVGIFKDY